ncbi:MAG: hypothetical protein DRP91_08740 [Candidatus Neomarinimicrobiota bacterium]|nr:MAG: hypothetical protein DRP91_08740 [Candidatus Neomarinimicrobiota bacterium]RKY51023.1 MAG: hypothetical protein DRP92_07515 [Candidatus Neomarinimicrobiota bacterium]
MKNYILLALIGIFLMECDKHGIDSSCQGSFENQNIPVQVVMLFDSTSHVIVKVEDKLLLEGIITPSGALSGPDAMFETYLSAGSNVVSFAKTNYESGIKYFFAETLTIEEKEKYYLCIFADHDTVYFKLQEEPFLWF